MNVNVTVRHTESTDALKEYARSKAEQLVEIFDHLLKAEVILDKAKEGQYSAEVVVSAPRGHVFVGTATEATATAAVDVVLDKIEAQIRKFKSRLRDRSAKEQERATRRLLRRQKRQSDSTLMAKEDSFGDLWW